MRMSEKDQENGNIKTGHQGRKKEERGANVKTFRTDSTRVSAICTRHCANSSICLSSFIFITTLHSRLSPFDKSKIQVLKQTCTRVFTVALFTMAKTTQMSITEERINKLRYTQTMEYYLVMKRNKVQTCAAMWMDLKNIMLSERRQTQQKAHTVWSHLYEILRIGKSTGKESRLVTARDKREKQDGE